MSERLPVPETITSILDRVHAQIEERVAVGGIDYIGVPTGFFKLDEATLGLRRNAYYIVGARSSMGKTAFATTVMKNVALLGKPVLYISLEMSSELLIYRLLSSLAGVPAISIERGKMEPDEHRRVLRAQEELRELPIQLFDRTMDTSDLQRILMQSQMDHNNELIILDYLTLLQSSVGNSIYERVTNLSEFMRLMARDLDIPLVVLAQLNREAERREDKTPILSDLRDSGSLEQDSFGTFLLHRPHYYNKLYNPTEKKNVEDDAVIIVAKNRQGPTGSLRATFIADRMEWTDPVATNRQPRSLAEKI